LNNYIGNDLNYKAYENIEDLSNYKSDLELELYRNERLKLYSTHVNFIKNNITVDSLRVVEVGSGSSALLYALEKSNMLTESSLGIEFSNSRYKFAERWREDCSFKNVNNVNNDNNVNKEKRGKEKPPRPRFKKPTTSEVIEFAIDNKIDLPGFHDYYESNGWMVGKNKMKDWKAAARNWAKRQPQYGVNNATYQQSTTTKPKTHHQRISQILTDDLKRSVAAEMDECDFQENGNHLSE